MKANRRNLLTWLTSASLIALGLASSPISVAAAIQGPPPIAEFDAPFPGLTPVNLRCEMMRAPVGVDVPRPRLSWTLDSPIRAEVQSAYQIIVGSGHETNTPNQAVLWDTGKVMSSETSQVEYHGLALQSGTRYWWKVRAWDQAGNASPWSRTAVWHTGLMTSADYHGKWIRADLPTDGASRGAPSPWIRKTFVLDAVPEHAWVFVNSLGYHELWVNGHKADNQVLAPAVSDYAKRAFTIAYNIAPFLHKGDNCIGVWLGRGWYVPGRPGVILPGPAMRLQAELTVGGNPVEIVSDETWKCAQSPYSTLGPWREGDYGGELVDARLDNPLWSNVACDDSRWPRAVSVPTPPIRIENQTCPPNKLLKEIPATTCTAANSGYVFDFGTCLSGWVRLHMPALATGTRVRFRYLDRIGGSDSNQLDEFISAGHADEVFTSKFNYHTFRYVSVEGLPSKPMPSDATALLIGADLETAGGFECSNPLLNRIYDMNVSTLRSLDIGGSTASSPNRDRRSGADTQVTIETAIMTSDMSTLYAKWLGDWRDSDDPATGGTAVQPPALAGVLAAIAVRDYLSYGDGRSLEASYDAMRRRLDAIEARCENGILRAHPSGDWGAPGLDADVGTDGAKRANEFFDNCYRVYLWDLQRRAAIALGRVDDAALCQAKLDEIRPLIHQEYYDPVTHVYALDEQAYECLPLLLGILPEAERSNVEAKLEAGILKRRNGHLDTGVLGTDFLVQYLAAAHRDDLLYTIAGQASYPGWGFMLASGATTTWESWNGTGSRLSASFASIGGWCISGLAGIQPDPETTAYRKFVIRPAIVGDLTWVNGHYDSVSGHIESDWKKVGNDLRMTVKVPQNTVATVYVPTADAKRITESETPLATANGVHLLRTEPGFAVVEVRGGSYQFESPLRLQHQ